MNRLVKTTMAFLFCGCAPALFCCSIEQGKSPSNEGYYSSARMNADYAGKEYIGSGTAYVSSTDARVKTQDTLIASSKQRPNRYN